MATAVARWWTCNGYVRRIHTVLANQSEMLHFEAAIDGARIETNRVHTDTGSANAANHQFLKQRKIHTSHVQERAAVGTPEAGK